VEEYTPGYNPNVNPQNGCQPRGVDSAQALDTIEGWSRHTPAGIVLPIEENPNVVEHVSNLNDVLTIKHLIPVFDQSSLPLVFHTQEVGHVIAGSAA
jgi:hypothetical protein